MNAKHYAITIGALSAAFISAAVYFTQGDAQKADRAPAAPQEICHDIPEWLISDYEEKHGLLNKDGECPFIKIKPRTAISLNLF